MSRHVDASALGDFTAPPATALLGQKPKHQRKGWNFLTWAFFLPHLVASEIFFGTGAKAAAQEDTRGDQNAPDDSTVTDSAPNEASQAVKSSEPGEQVGGEAFHGSQPTGAHMRMDAQETSALLGLTAVGKIDTESLGGGGGGGGGGSQAIGSSLGTSNVAESVPSDPALAHTSGVAVSDLQDFVGVPEPPDFAAVFRPATVGDSTLTGEGVSFLPARPNSSPETTQPPESLNQPPGFHDPGLSNGQAVSNQSTLDLLPEGGLAVEVKALLGFEISLNADGLTANLGIGHFADLLGFDAHLSADGIFAGVNVGLPGAVSTAESLVSGVTSNVESALHIAGAELSNILALDSHFGSVLMPAILGSDPGTIAQSVKSTLADVTGVHLFGGTGEGQTTQLFADLAGVAAGGITQITESASVEQPGGFLAKAHVLSDLSEIIGLTHKGDISSGDVINFPGPPFGLVDELFAGLQYTDYNVTLQAQKSGAAEHEAATSSASGASGSVASIMDIPLSHDSESIQLTNDDTHDNLLHTSLSVLHLASH